MMGEDLADQENLFAASFNCFADKHFCVAVGVHFCRVDQAHAQVDTEAQCRDLVSPPAGVLGHMPGALTQRGNDFTMGKGDGSERGQYSHGCSCCECCWVVFPCARGIMTKDHARRAPSKDSAGACAA
jgi:hypothetical protein